MNSSPLRTLLNKQVRKTIGLMSGTSADGVDIAFCEIDTASSSLRNMASTTVPYSKELQDEVLSLVAAGSVSLRRLAALSTYLGHFYADAIEQFCRIHQIEADEIDLIGSHGQTVSHLSEPLDVLGKRSRGSLQIGETEVIAKRLGVLAVSDFRTADIAVGGSGAPLVPIYHHARFALKGKTAVIANIGGIANITVLDGTDSCIATDTGPGNCLIDTCMRKFYGKSYDADGETAMSGKVDEKLLNSIMNEDLLKKSFPISYDRKELLDLLGRHESALIPGTSNSITTVSELTIATIANAINRIAASKRVDEIILCGGGVHNLFLTSRLRSCFPSSRVTTSAEHGSNPDFVEAEAFAYLANLCLDGVSGNLLQATGASRPAILGKISQP